MKLGAATAEKQWFRSYQTPCLSAPVQTGTQTAVVLSGLLFGVDVRF